MEKRRSTDIPAGRDSHAEGFADLHLRYKQKSAARVRYAQSESGIAGTDGTDGDTPVSGPGGLHVYERSVAAAASAPGQERMFWDWLKNGYDILVFDYSPLQENALLIDLGDFADKVLLTVLAERSNKHVVHNALGILTQYGLTPDGLILAGRRLHIPQSIYRNL